MAITFDSFIDWSGFSPGPQFPEARTTFDLRRTWARSITLGAESSLIPAIPSVLDKPHVDEWQPEISTVEWKTLAPLWQTMAEQILINDPVFKPFQGPWYVTADGKWTAQFRKHPTFEVLREELVLRLQEEYETYRRIITDINRGAPRPARVPSGDDADPFAGDWEPRDDEDVVAHGWGWLKTAYRVGRIGTLFSPTGVGWIALEHGVKYGVHKYNERQERQERERRRAERRDERRRNRSRALADSDLPDGSWAQALEQSIRGFVSSVPSVGMFAIEGPGAKFKWRSIIGSPEALTSQDGVYL